MGTSVEEAAIFFDRLYFEHDLEQFREMARSRRPVVLCSETADGGRKRSPRHRELLGPLRLEHEMRAVFAVGGHLWGSMDLIRERGSLDFDNRQVTLLRRIAPHLGNGLKSAALRIQAPTGRGRSDVPGVLTLDHRGQVVQHTPVAERWLQEIEDLCPGWRGWAGLPSAVRMVVGALKRTLKPGNDREAEGVPRLRLRGRSGCWLTLYGSLTEATPDRPGETVIVIEPAKPEELLPFSMAAYGLSAREEEVVKLLVRGLSTTRISQTLYISEYTVQNHLRNVFEKVGVRSRGELVRLLFFDNLYPSLFG